MGEGNDTLHLHGNITGTTLDGGEGRDVLHLSLDAATIGQVLTDDSVAMIGFEDLILDMANSSADTLNVDALLVSLKVLAQSGTDAIFIRGDADDTVSLQDDGWQHQQDETVEADGIVYDVYRHGDDLTLYIQEVLSTTGL